MLWRHNHEWKLRQLRECTVDTVRAWYFRVQTRGDPLRIYLHLYWHWLIAWWCFEVKKHGGNAILIMFASETFFTSLLDCQPCLARAAPCRGPAEPQSLSLGSVSMTKKIKKAQDKENNTQIPHLIQLSSNLQSVCVELCRAPFFQFRCPWSLQAYLPTCSTSSTFTHWYSKHLDNLTVLVPSC